MEKDEGQFVLQKRVFRDTDYEVSSSNAYYTDFEALNYSLNVIPDERPKIELRQLKDSLRPNDLMFEGSVSDDYGLKELRLAAYPIRNPDSTFYQTLPLEGEVFSRIDTRFPVNEVPLAAGGYRVYVEAKDNDGNRKGKWARSAEFEYRVSTQQQQQEQEREEREGLTEGLERSLEKLKKANEKVADYQESRKDAQNMRFSERDQLKNALEEQIQQEEMMKRFSQELRNNLEDKEDARMLAERLKRQEQLAERNKRLLDELKKMASELESEELKKELDESAKNQRAQQRSLEQLVELTKRFLVKEKLKELSVRFDELSKKQSELEEKEVSKENRELQESLRESFEKESEELRNALKKNADLRKPYPVEDAESIQRKEKELLQGIKEGQEDNKPAEATKRQQKRSAERLKELSDSLDSASSGGQGMEQQQEDIETLRKIMDNLIEFTFEAGKAR